MHAEISINSKRGLKCKKNKPREKGGGEREQEGENLEQSSRRTRLGASFVMGENVKSSE